ncbi:MAG TPA: ECF-type sigma factor [Phycisphaerales bacterium]|nr:ECF-type sigma factor [Phycisphaerales bacterium]
MQLPPQPGAASEKPALSAPENLTSDLEILVDRIARGDRDAAAEFVSTYGPFLRRRIRAKLDHSLRRIWDSEDIFATVCRRLDEFVERKSVRATSVAEMLTLLRTIAQHSIVDKGRILTRLRRAEDEDAAFASSLERSIGAPTDTAGLDIQTCLSWIESERDREILEGWLLGHSHESIALDLGITPELCRKRWQLIRERLRARLEGEGSQ